MRKNRMPYYGIPGPGSIVTTPLGVRIFKLHDRCVAHCHKRRWSWREPSFMRKYYPICHYHEWVKPFQPPYFWGHVWKIGRSWKWDSQNYGFRHGSTYHSWLHWDVYPSRNCRRWWPDLERYEFWIQFTRWHRSWHTKQKIRKTEVKACLKFD